MKRFIAAVGVFSTLAFGLGSGALRAQSAGTITTVAGNGTPGTTGDGGPATNAELGIGNLSIAPDYQGNLYILDQQTNHLRKVTPAGIITTIGGGGTAPRMARPSQTLCHSRASAWRPTAPGIYTCAARA